MLRAKEEVAEKVSKFREDFTFIKFETREQGDCYHYFQRIGVSFLKVKKLPVKRRNYSN